MAGGGAGGATMLAPWRGRGTILRGAGADVEPTELVVAGACGAGALTGGAGAAAAATTGRGGTAFGAGGAAAATDGATTVGRDMAGGAAFTAASACRRSRMARTASPGLAALDRSIFGTYCAPPPRDAPPPDRLPPLMYPRTFSASSDSMELECVFFSVTPTAVSASRMVLLLTSSSRAKSLIRTLFIRPFSLPLRP